MYISRKIAVDSGPGPWAVTILAMTDSELAARLDDFQRVIEARDVEAAESVLDEAYALVLVQPVARRSREPSGWQVFLTMSSTSGPCRSASSTSTGTAQPCCKEGFNERWVQGLPRDGLFVVSDIWRRRDGVWRYQQQHSSPLSAGEMPSA